MNSDTKKTGCDHPECGETDTCQRQGALERMTVLDEEMEAEHPGWMTGRADPVAGVDVRSPMAWVYEKTYPNSGKVEKFVHLKRDEFAAGKGWTETPLFALTRQPTSAVVGELEADVARLRAALIECGRAAGGYLTDDVTTDFLMLVPDEVHARIGQLADACAPDDTSPQPTPAKGAEGE